MPVFGKSSRRQLVTAHPDLQRLFAEVVKYWDCTVLEGHRAAERQTEMVRSGKSKVRYPMSRHNAAPSLAVDVAPYPINWGDLERFYAFGGFVIGVAIGLGIKVRWGGDWDSDRDVHDQTFIDLPHFELAGSWDGDRFQPETR